MTRKTYVTLDALRGAAAIFVLLFHADIFFGEIAPSGYLAVDFFFCLSGFVIAHAYDERLAGGMKSSDFILRRLKRFYPLYLLGLLIALPRELMLTEAGNAYAFPPLELMLAFGAALLFLPFPVEQRANQLFSMNIPSWSLFFELVINAVYAIVFRFLNRRSLTAILLLSGGACALLTIRAGTADLGAELGGFGAGLARSIFSFTAGVMIFRFLPRFETSLALPVVLALSLFLAVGQIGVAYELAFIFVLSPAIVILGASSEPPARLKAVFSYLGTISFPLYAIHYPVLMIGKKASEMFEVPPIAMGIVCVAAILIVCPFLVRWWDLPIRRRLDAIQRNSSAAKMSASPDAAS